MRLGALALVSVFSCTLAAAQAAQSQIMAISPGGQIFPADGVGHTEGLKKSDQRCRMKRS